MNLIRVAELPSQEVQNIKEFKEMSNEIKRVINIKRNKKKEILE